MTRYDGMPVPARVGHEDTPAERTTNTPGEGPLWSLRQPRVRTGTNTGDQQVPGDGA
jgi:hypothetical protein